MAKAKENIIKLSKKKRELLSHGQDDTSPEVKRVEKKIKTVKKNQRANSRRHFLKNRRQNPETLIEKAIHNKKVYADPTTGFDEFGVIIFKDNTDSLVIGLPDFDEKLLVKKSKKRTYETLITNTVFKAAVNKVRENRNECLNNSTKEKNTCIIGLAKAIPVARYNQIPFILNIENVDEKLSDIQPPVCSFISINIKDVCEQANKTLQPMEYRSEVVLYEESNCEVTVKDILDSTDPRELFNSEFDILMTSIQKESDIDFIASLSM